MGQSLIVVGPYPIFERDFYAYVDWFFERPQSTAGVMLSIVQDMVADSGNPAPFGILNENYVYRAYEYNPGLIAPEYDATFQTHFEYSDESLVLRWSPTLFGAGFDAHHYKVLIMPEVDYFWSASETMEDFFVDMNSYAVHPVDAGQFEFEIPKSHYLNATQEDTYYWMIGAFNAADGLLIASNVYQLDKDEELDLGDAYDLSAEGRVDVPIRIHADIQLPASGIDVGRFNPSYYSRR